MTNIYALGMHSHTAIWHAKSDKSDRDKHL